MFLIDVLIIGIIFYGVHYLGTKNEEPTQPKQITGVRLQQLLHKYRTYGVDKIQMEDIQAELARRGRTDVPMFDGHKSDPEVAAELEMMLEQTPYVPRELAEAGEDRTVSKSTFSYWLRPEDEEAGDT
jgi:hypothetical protein